MSRTLYWSSSTVSFGIVWFDMTQTQYSDGFSNYRAFFRFVPTDFEQFSRSFNPKASQRLDIHTSRIPQRMTGTPRNTHQTNSVLSGNESIVGNQFERVYQRRGLERDPACRLARRVTCRSRSAARAIPAAAARVTDPYLIRELQSPL